MIVEYVLHARKRMDTYGITEKMVEMTLREPDAALEGKFGRMIYQFRLNGHILRVIVEEEAEIKRVLTVYKTGSERYEI